MQRRMPYHGTYDGTIYFNEANHFSIIVVRTQDPSIPAQARNAAQLRGRWHKPGSSLFVAVGHDLPRTSAVELELDGEWVTGKHGCQLQVEQWREIVKQTPEGIRAYLGSGLIKGIGPQLADAIVHRFGADALHVLEHDPERLTEIPGITERKLADIQASYAESRALRDLMSLLGPFQVTPATAVKVYEFFGPTCVEILRSRPYELCRISGFGFKRVDAIIRKTDKRLDTPDRIQGALMYALQEAGTQQGHLYLPRTEFLQTAMQLLNSTVPQPKLHLHTDQVEAVLQDAILHGDLVANEDAIYLARVFAREDETARRIAQRLICPDRTFDIEEALTKVKETLGICLSSQQERAVQAAFHHSLSIITGSPGTGKTTVLRAIIEVFRCICPDKKLLLMAPTGRASRRMAESTGVTDANVRELIFDNRQQTPYLGVGFVIKKQVNGVIWWRAVVLTKVMFSVPSDSATTQGETIEWQTQALTATIMRSDAAKHPWFRMTSLMDSEADAEAAVKQYLSIADA